MLRNTLLLLILVGLASACFRGPDDISEPKDNPNMLKPGKYVQAEGKVINMDSVAEPKFFPVKGKYVKTATGTVASPINDKETIRILEVDDEPINQQVLKNHLSGKGF